MSNTQNTNAAQNNAAKPTPPAKLKPGSWNFLPQQKAIDPDTSRRNIEARVLPTRVYDPKRKPGVKSLATGFGSNTVGGPASIVELTRALRDNVDLIYEWVHNNVETLTNYGIHKGGLGALTDGFGNSFDQADLMVKLLRQAGYTANYVSGELRMNAADAGAWLGTDPTNIFASGNFLGNSYTPVNTVWTGTEWVVDFSHCWVECTIGGTVYTFDPTIKSYSTVAGINLATAMGYNATTFMSDATSGATITSDYVENINRTNIRDNLDDLTMNLVNYIKTNAHGATMDEILGGRTINQYDASVPLRQTVHPFLKAGTTPTVWTSVPNAYRATLHVVYDTIDETFYTDDLSNTRLTLFFNASHEAELRLDGTLIATSSAQTPGSWNSVFLEIVHPYAVTWADQSVWEQVWADKPHLICSSFGMTSRSSSQVHSRKMKANHANGGANDSDEVLGELMAALWGMWAASTSKTNDLVNRMTNCTSVVHHAAGLIGWYDTPFTNIGLVAQTTSALDNNYNQQQYNDTVLAMHGVAFEAQVFKQFGRIDGVSSTPIIDGAVAAGQKIYDGKTANWNSVVVPNVVNYTSGELADIESWWVNWGNRVALPEDGAQVVGSWNGFGYLVMPSFGTFGIIQGGLKGGGGACSLPIDDFVQGSLYREITNTTCGGGGTYDEYDPSQILGQSGLGGGIDSGNGGSGNANANEEQSAEPIDLTTGDYILKQFDLTIGSQSVPYGLGFSRSYNSAARYQDGPLGLGWKHNFQITAQKGTDALMGLGDHSIIGAAGSIVELFVSLDIQSDLSKPFDKYIVCAVGNQWFIDNLVDNTAMLCSGHRQMVYVKLPTGGFAPPRGVNGFVADTGGGAFTFTALGGVVTTFNSDGRIATLTTPYGVTQTFSYSAGNLTSVANNLGRVLTLNYTGTRLTSVSDGTGRSVGFVVDANKNLIAVTDASNEDRTFEYDLPGRMTKFFQPEFPSIAVAVNTYNSLDQVTQQADANSNNWQYYYAGSRTEEENPNSKSSVRYFNRHGQLVRYIDQLGQFSTIQYDGRGRVTRTTAREGNAVDSIYNALDQLIQMTAKSKPGSGLGDVVSSITYDPVWNKVATQTNHMGQTSSRTYDATTGQIVSVTSPTITGIGTGVVTFTHNSRGQILTVTDTSGMVSKFIYHATMEMLISSVLDFGGLNLTRSFGYDSVGNMTSAQDPLGNVATFSFDSLRRVKQITAPSPFNYLTKFTYDKNGNKVKVERETGDANQPWQIYQSSYSAEGLLLSTVNPLGRTATYEYDSLKRLWKTSDPMNRQMIRTYDDANRLTTIIDPTSIVCQAYVYTANGKVASLQDARGNSTQFTFDGFDRPDKTIYMDGTFEQVLAYDGNSNPTTILLRKDHPTSPVHRYKIDLTYDEVDRIKTKVVTDDVTVRTTTNTYDIAGRLINVALSGSAFGTGSYSRFFDTAGRFYKEEYPDTKAVTHVLDANGNVIKTTYPDGSYYVERVYDALDRLTDIKLNGAGTSAIQFEYDKLSRRTKIVYENGTETRNDFHEDNTILSLAQTFVGSDVVFSFDFDSVSQMSCQNVSDPQFNWHPLVAGTDSYATANGIDQYATVAGISQGYDSSGCLTNDGFFTYVFDAENMLIQVKNAAGSATIADYLYDPMRRQVQKLVGSSKTNFYYSGFQRLADYDGNTDTLQNRYVYGANLDEVFVQIASGGAKTFYHHNSQGSVIATTNSSGVVVDRYKYGPFGESAVLTGTTHGYTGQRYDAETGLYFYKMRYYSPRIGRFLQPDPMGMSGGINLYNYVNNRPLNLADSLGLSADSGSGAGGGGSSGGSGGGSGGGDSGGYVMPSAYELDQFYIASGYKQFKRPTLIGKTSVEYNDLGHELRYRNLFEVKTYTQATGAYTTTYEEGPWVNLPDYGVWIEQAYDQGPTHQIIVVGDYNDKSTAIASSFSGYVNLIPPPSLPDLHDLLWGYVESGTYNDVSWNLLGAVIRPVSERIGAIFGQETVPQFHALPIENVVAAQKYLLKSSRYFYWWEQDSFNLIYNNCHTYAENQFDKIVDKFGVE